MLLLVAIVYHYRDLIGSRMSLGQARYEASAEQEEDQDGFLPIRPDFVHRG